MLQINLKLITIIAALFFLTDCDKKKKPPSEVSSGIAQVQTNIFTKTCQAGSLKITKNTRTSATAVLKPHDLPVGSEVTISGTVQNGSLCGFAGSVSFGCKAVVKIGLNKGFSCTGNYIISGSSGGLGSTPVRPVTPLPAPLGSSPGPQVSGPSSPAPAPFAPNYNSSYHQRALLSGDFIIYYGATKTFSALTVNSSSPLVPATCKLSFICE